MLAEKTLASGYRARAFAKYLRQAGHRVDIACTAALAKGAEANLLNERDAINGVPRKPGVLRRVVDRLIWLPEPQRRLVKPAAAILTEYIGMHRPDVVLVTSPPHTIQLIGAELARATGVPYVADLRDDWLTNDRYRWHTPVHRWIAAQCERFVVQSASRVILNTLVVEDRMKKRYPTHAWKMSTITNGYDEDEIDSASDLPWSADHRRIIAYTGSMYGRYMWVRFCQLATALEKMRMTDDWCIVTAGHGMAPPAPLRQIWEHKGVLSPSDAAGLAKAASCVVIAMPPGERTPSGTVPLKTYIYLATGTPIVYFGEKGATSEILAEFAGCVVKDRREWPGFATWLASQPLRDEYERPGVERYSFRNLTQKLIEVLEAGAISTPDCDNGCRLS